MRYLLYIALSLTFLISCEKDKKIVFGVDVPKDQLHFKPVPGGAVMHYALPKSKEIYAINIYYTDEQGEYVRVSGSYLSDSLVLTGFTVARNDIKGKVTLEDRDQNESNSIDVSFNTDDSGTVSFFKGLKIDPHWSGFRLEYNGQPNTKGLAHVFYKGVNPLTQQPDTILLETFPIVEGVEVKYYDLKKGGNFNDVIISTQDNRGYIAKQQTFPKIESLLQKKIKYGDDYSFEDPFGLSQNADKPKLGVEFLFDGDTKGVKAFDRESNDPIYYTFAAGPNALSEEGNPKYFVLDLKSEMQVSNIRMHSMLDVRYFPPIYEMGNLNLYSDIWNNNYPTVLPCHVKAYGSNDVGDVMQDKNWVELVTYFQNAETAVTDRWSKKSAENGTASYIIKQVENLEQEEDLYLTLNFPAKLAKYRYIRLDVLDTFYRYRLDFNPPYDKYNDKKYFSINELEVFVEDEK